MNLYWSAYSYAQMVLLGIITLYIMYKGVRVILCGCERRGYIAFRRRFFPPRAEPRDEVLEDADGDEIIDMRPIAVPVRFRG